MSLSNSMMEKPLVSVLVVTYNSDEYIEETLDSVKNQTYQNLELIVTDDGSTDNTISKVEQWLSVNSNRFVNSTVVTVDKNTGVSANYNRGVRSCNGEWIKNVDGDDLLLPNCIEDNVQYVGEHSEINVLFSDLLLWKFEGQWVKKPYNDSEKLKEFGKLTCEEQLLSIAQYNVLPSQTCFVRACLLRENPYNEQYVGIEDYPMWFHLIKSHNKVYFMDKFTALYRVCESTTVSNQRFFSPFYLASFRTFFWNELAPFLKSNNLTEGYLNYRRYLMLCDFTDCFLKNKKNFVHRVMYKIFVKVLSKLRHFS